MRKKTCKDCKYYNPISSLCIVKGVKVFASAVGCPINYVKHTTFDRITASQEVLEETLAYKITTMNKTIIASVERLKEVCQ